MKNLINYYSVGFKISLFPTLLFVLGHFILWEKMTNKETQNDLLVVLIKFLPGYLLWSYSLSNRADLDVDENQITPFAAFLTVLGFMLTTSPWQETIISCLLVVAGSVLFSQYLKKQQDKKQQIVNEILKLVPSETVKSNGNLKDFEWDEEIIVPQQKLCSDSIKLIFIGIGFLVLDVAMITYSWSVQDKVLIFCYTLITIMLLVAVYLLRNSLQYHQTESYIKSLGFIHYPSYKGFPSLRGALYVKNDEFYHVLSSEDDKQFSIRKLG